MGMPPLPGKYLNLDPLKSPETRKFYLFQASFLNFLRCNSSYEIKRHFHQSGYLSKITKEHSVSFPLLQPFLVLCASLLAMPNSLTQ